MPRRPCLRYFLALAATALAFPGHAAEAYFIQQRVP
jgi:hypothetical protein